jgi:hypothetical protein
MPAVSSPSWPPTPTSSAVGATARTSPASIGAATQLSPVAPPVQGEAADFEPAAQLPRLSGRHALAILVALLVGVLGVALLLPAMLRPVAIVLGFVAGAGFERYRQDHLPLPPALAETPSIWWWKLRDEIGVGTTLVALVLAAAAVAVVGLSVTGGSDHTLSDASPPAAAGGGAGPAPELAIREEPAGAFFEAAGASFRVLPAAGAGWASTLPAAPGEGLRWIAVAVEARAATRDLAPATLSFRLSDAEGGLYYPDQQGSIGAPSLTERGFLSPGESAEVRLGFRVPVAAEGLALEFEPRAGAAAKLRISLP